MCCVAVHSRVEPALSCLAGSLLFLISVISLITRFRSFSLFVVVVVVETVVPCLCSLRLLIIACHHRDDWGESQSQLIAPNLKLANAHVVAEHHCRIVSVYDSGIDHQAGRAAEQRHCRRAPIGRCKDRNMNQVTYTTPPSDLVV